MSHSVRLAALVIFASGIVLIAVPAQAGPLTGPAYPPPNGVTLGATGNPGRAGGFTWSYSDIDLTDLLVLYWGPSAPILEALDGGVDSPCETLSFTGFTASTATWQGTSTIYLAFGGATTAYTRFTLTVAGAASLVSVESAGITNGNSVVAAVGGDYSVILLFEASLDGSNYTPVLDLVDSLQTLPPTSPDGVITSFYGGFWWRDTRGDLDCNGAVDFADINPFVLYLSNYDLWLQTYPECPPTNGDVNGDGVYPSFGDINPFVALLTGAP